MSSDSGHQQENSTQILLPTLQSLGNNSSSSQDSENSKSSSNEDTFVENATTFEDLPQNDENEYPKSNVIDVYTSESESDSDIRNFNNLNNNTLHNNENNDTLISNNDDTQELIPQRVNSNHLKHDTIQNVMNNSTSSSSEEEINELQDEIRRQTRQTIENSNVENMAHNNNNQTMIEIINEYDILNDIKKTQENSEINTIEEEENNHVSNDTVIDKTIENNSNNINENEIMTDNVMDNSTSENNDVKVDDIKSSDNNIDNHSKKETVGENFNIFKNNHSSDDTSSDESIENLIRLQTSPRPKSPTLKEQQEEIMNTVEQFNLDETSNNVNLVEPPPNNSNNSSNINNDSNEQNKLQNNINTVPIDKSDEKPVETQEDENEKDELDDEMDEIEERMARMRDMYSNKPDESHKPKLESLHFTLGNGELEFGEKITEKQTIEKIEDVNEIEENPQVTEKDKEKVKTPNISMAFDIPEVFESPLVDTNKPEPTMEVPPMDLEPQKQEKKEVKKVKEIKEIKPKKPKINEPKKEVKKKEESIIVIEESLPKPQENSNKKVNKQQLQQHQYQITPEPGAVDNSLLAYGNDINTPISPSFNNDLSLRPDLSNQKKSVSFNPNIPDNVDRPKQIRVRSYSHSKGDENNRKYSREQSENSRNRRGSSVPNRNKKDEFDRQEKNKANLNKIQQQKEEAKLNYPWTTKFMYCFTISLNTLFFLTLILSFHYGRTYTQYKIRLYGFVVYYWYFLVFTPLYYNKVWKKDEDTIWLRDYEKEDDMSVNSDNNENEFTINSACSGGKRAFWVLLMIGLCACSTYLALQHKDLLHQTLMPVMILSVIFKFSLSGVMMEFSSAMFVRYNVIITFIVTLFTLIILALTKQTQSVKVAFVGVSIWVVELGYLFISVFFKVYFTNRKESLREKLVLRLSEKYPMYNILEQYNKRYKKHRNNTYLDANKIRLRIEEKYNNEFNNLIDDQNGDVVVVDYDPENELVEGAHNPVGPVSPRFAYNVHGGDMYAETYDYEHILFRDELEDSDSDKQNLIDEMNSNENESEYELEVRSNNSESSNNDNLSEIEYDENGNIVNDPKKKQKIRKNSKAKKRPKYKKKKKITIITFCCCCKVKIKRFFKVQAFMSALSFWGVFGVLLLAPAEDIANNDTSDSTNSRRLNMFMTTTVTPVTTQNPASDAFGWVTFPLVFFLINSSWFNPAYWSTTRFYMKKVTNKICFYFYWFLGVIIGLVSFGVFILFWFFNRNGSDKKAQTEVILVLLSFFVAAFYYFPMTGYLFYRVPVMFGLSHLLSASVSLIIPLIFIGNSEEINRRKVAGVKFTLRVNRRGMLLAAMISFAVFLAVSGFSCTYFRNKKAILEAQSRVIDRKASKQKEIHMGLIMFGTFTFSIADFFSDALFAFYEKNINEIIRYLVWGLFFSQIIVQLVSLSSAVSKLRKIIAAPNTYPATKSIKINLQKYFGFLCCLCYPFSFILYFLFIILVTISLTLSKLMSIKQIQNWWLSLMVVNYKDELIEVKRNKIEEREELKYAIELHDIHKQMKQEKSNQLISSHKEDNYNNVSQLDKLREEKVRKLKEEMDVDGLYRKKRLEAVKGNYIWILYYKIDDLAPKWLRRAKVNTEVYNNYFLTELICESFPQLLLNVANAWIKDNWTVISLVSAFFSGSIIAYNLTKIIYYVGLKNKDLKQFLL